MIGTKKLVEIREEILKSLGKDPIGRLEKIIAKAKRAGDQTELTEGLKRFLERGPKPVKKQIANHKGEGEGAKIMEDLERFIQGAQKATRRKRRASVKK